MKKKAKVYLFPFELESNNYILETKSILSGGSFEVVAFPSSLKSIYNVVINKVFKKERAVIIFNWLEDAPSQSNNPFTKFLICCSYLFLSKILFSKIVWVRHNFKPHNQCYIFYYKCLKYLLYNISNERVSHRPLKNYTYIPHPMYPLPVSEFSDIRKNDFLIFGSIKKYKGVYELLCCWPKDKKLVIAGKCSDPELINDIEQKIRERCLSVIWHNEFVDDGDLDLLILDTKVVVLSHISSEMIVSGVFFHAASLGTTIVQRNNCFAHWCNSEFTFSSIFELKTIKSDLEKVNVVDPMVINLELNKFSGVDVLTHKWGDLLS